MDAVAVSEWGGDAFNRVSEASAFFTTTNAALFINRKEWVRELREAQATGNLKIWKEDRIVVLELGSVILGAIYGPVHKSRSEAEPEPDARFEKFDSDFEKVVADGGLSAGKPMFIMGDFNMWYGDRGSRAKLGGNPKATGKYGAPISDRRAIDFEQILTDMSLTVVDSHLPDSAGIHKARELRARLPIKRARLTNTRETHISPQGSFT